MDARLLDVVRSLQAGPFDETTLQQVRTCLGSLRRDGQNHEVEQHRAELVEMLGVFAGAATSAQVAAGAHLLAADLCEMMADREGAIEALSRAQVADPGGRQAAQRLQAALSTERDRPRLHALLSERIAVLSASADDTPTALADALQQFGRLAADMGEVDQAIEAYDRALELQPSLTMAEKLASLHERRRNDGDLATAADLYCMLAELDAPARRRIHLERALAIHPQHEEAQAQLEQLAQAPRGSAYPPRSSGEFQGLKGGHAGMGGSQGPRQPSFSAPPVPAGPVSASAKRQSLPPPPPMLSSQPPSAARIRSSAPPPMSVSAQGPEHRSAEAALGPAPAVGPVPATGATGVHATAPEPAAPEPVVAAYAAQNRGKDRGVGEDPYAAATQGEPAAAFDGGPADSAFASASESTHRAPASAQSPLGTPALSFAGESGGEGPQASAVRARRFWPLLATGGVLVGTYLLYGAGLLPGVLHDQLASVEDTVLTAMHFRPRRSGIPVAAAPGMGAGMEEAVGEERVGHGDGPALAPVDAGVAAADGAPDAATGEGAAEEERLDEAAEDEAAEDEAADLGVDLVEASFKVTGVRQPGRDAVREGLEAVLPALAECRPKAKARRRATTGRLLYRFQIGAKRSRAVKRVSGDIRDRKLNRCVLQELKSLRFPQVRGRAVKVRVAFEFLGE